MISILVKLYLVLAKNNNNCKSCKYANDKFTSG